MIPEISGMQDLPAVTFYYEHIGISRRMTEIIRSDPYVADSDCLVRIILLESQNCIEGSLEFFAAFFMRDIFHVGIEFQLDQFRQPSEILVNAFLCNGSFKSDMVSVIVGIENRRDPVKKPVKISRYIVFVFRLAVSIRQVVSEIDKDFCPGGRLYLCYTASYLVYSSVDGDLHSFGSNLISTPLSRQ